MTKTTEQSPDSDDKVATGATKFDLGKAPIWRGALSYFPLALEQVALVSLFGATKYQWRGWENVDDGINRYSDALARHLAYEGSGLDVDDDSNLLHAAHTAWNALARLELILKQRDQIEVVPDKFLEDPAFGKVTPEDET